MDMDRTAVDDLDRGYGDGPDEQAEPLTEEELTRLALADHLPTVPAADAVPMADFLGSDDGLLPTWYMPSPMARVGGRWRLPVVLVLVGAFLLIEALGLCSTFGQLVPA